MTVYVRFYFFLIAKICIPLLMKIYCFTILDIIVVFVLERWNGRIVEKLVFKKKKKNHAVLNVTIIIF